MSIKNLALPYWHKDRKEYPTRKECLRAIWDGYITLVTEERCMIPNLTRAALFFAALFDPSVVTAFMIHINRVSGAAKRAGYSR